jgi:ABC-type transporter Mla maintaining outer membrane lipid asymmetry ATPase subunit MlaF
MAKFRYNPDSGELVLARDKGRALDVHTVFMVMQEGRLVFEGPQDELEASTDSYISRFVKHANN